MMELYCCKPLFSFICICRSSGAEFLVAGGPSKTWIVANSLVTITTSGQGGGRSGTCMRCASTRNQPHPPIEVPPPDSLSSPAPQLCSCWCRGWAEINIRRPSGNISWLMRVQNRLQPLHPSQLGQRMDGQLGLVALNLPTPAEKSNTGITADVAEYLSPAVEEQRSEPVSREETEIDTVVSKETTCESQRGQDDDQQTDGDVSPSSSHEDGSSEVVHLASERFPIGSSTASPSRHQHTSQSWTGDDGGIPSVPLSPKPSSYSTHFPLDHLPPLLSYDESEGGCGRSPRLHGNSEVLSEEEQLSLHASMSDIATSHSDQSEGKACHLQSKLRKYFFALLSDCAPVQTRVTHPQGHQWRNLRCFLVPVKWKMTSLLTSGRTPPLCHTPLHSMPSHSHLFRPLKAVCLYQISKCLMTHPLDF